MTQKAVSDVNVQRHGCRSQTVDRLSVVSSVCPSSLEVTQSVLVIHLEAHRFRGHRSVPNKFVHSDRVQTPIVLNELAETDNMLGEFRGIVDIGELNCLPSAVRESDRSLSECLDHVTVPDFDLPIGWTHVRHECVIVGNTRGSSRI